MEQVIYDVDYFLRKFSAIREDHWLISRFTDGVRCCALGHCGMDGDKYLSDVPEAIALYRLCPIIHSINDGVIGKYCQATPKQRVIAALWDIKKAQYPEISDPPVYVENFIQDNVNA